MAMPIVWRDRSGTESRGQEQNTASGAYASPRLPIRELQWAYSLLLLSAACAMRASFQSPFLPSTEGCPLILAPYAARHQTSIACDPSSLPSASLLSHSQHRYRQSPAEILGLAALYLLEDVPLEI